MLHRSSWKAILAILSLVLLTVWSAAVFARDERLYLYFFDVGQGDSILIKKRNFELLIDGGPDHSILSHLGRTLPPWDRTIEIVVLTHPHADHVAGLNVVLSRYGVGEIWGTGTVHTSNIYLDFLRTLRDKNIPYRVVTAGEHLDREGIIAQVLAPLANLSGKRLENANLSSIVVKLSYGAFSALLTGDAEEEVQEDLVQHADDLQATVLKVPHQGSRDADLPSFLERVHPSLAILSVGEKNRYGHPHIEVLTRYREMGIPILRTDHDGTITVKSDGQKIWIETTKTDTMAEMDISDVWSQ